MKLQTIDNMQGEINFRKLLAQQHVTGEILLPDYYAKEQHDEILLERVNTTLTDISKLKQLGIFLSPFIELGAERCQRALVLANDFNAEGFAVDISYHQLKTAQHYAKMFNKAKLPVRVCCDVNHLPFRNNSFPFVFCYEFLHHFPSLKPVINEIYRILSNGVFFFSEEPYKRPKISMYKQKNKIYSKSRLRMNKMIRFLELFISETYCDEREYGICENHDIPLKEWIAALSIFGSRQVHLSSVENRIRSELKDLITMNNLSNMLLGGNIGGICRKESTDLLAQVPNLTDLLLCPDCLINGNEQMIQQLPLLRTGNNLSCTVCGSSFPVVDDIIFLFPRDLFRKLYPELAN